MLLAICADRGAPGSTTTALALAAARGLPAVVVEADPYGGDLALRIHVDGNPLPTTPTVLSVSAGRSAQEPTSGPLGMPPNGASARRHRDLWRDGAHQLTDQVRVVPGFMAAEHGSSMGWPVLASALEAQSVPIFADLGRIHTGSPSLSVAAAADALIPVCRGDMASVQHMVDRLELLVPAIADRNGRPPVVLPVVVASRQHGSRIASSVAEILGETAVGPALRGVGWLAWDPAAVTHLENGADPWAKPLGKSALMRSARKAMSILGVVTGLTYTDPAAKRGGNKLTARLRGDDEATATTEGGQGRQSWVTPVPQPQSSPQPGAQQPHMQANEQRDPPPPRTPSPAWTARQGAAGPHDATSSDQAYDRGGDRDGDRDSGGAGETSGTAAVRGRWETTARQLRH